MKKALLLVATHAFVLAVGAALGIYLLPILAAPPAPTTADVASASRAAKYTGEFRRQLKGSDALHWGEGRVSLGPDAISLAGRVAPGPAYKLYLLPGFVETHDDFVRLKPQSLAVGDVKTFENFIVPVPAGTKLEDYRAVVVWCEAFSQFITAARYR
ncbi:MAG: DM13 domain-containing protein [Burkholderiales bacterium]|nr:DM13 domain-containing protein [Burkholderiales bacterium]